MKAIPRDITEPPTTLLAKLKQARDEIPDPAPQGLVWTVLASVASNWAEREKSFALSGGQS